MTVTTDAPSALAGISAAELAAMQEAAGAFRQQFTGAGRHETVSAGGTSVYRHGLSAAGVFGVLAVATDAPAPVAGISAAGLAAMRGAANAFREQFTGGQGRHQPVEINGIRIYRDDPDVFGVLTEPYSAPSGRRAQYAIIGNGGHQCD